MELYILAKDGTIAVDKRLYNLRKLSDQEQSHLFMLLAAWKVTGGTQPFRYYLINHDEIDLTELYMPLPDHYVEAVKKGMPTRMSWLTEQLTEEDHDLFYDPTPRVFAVYHLDEGTLSMDSGMAKLVSEWTTPAEEQVTVELATQTIKDQNAQIKRQDKLIDVLYKELANRKNALTRIYKVTANPAYDLALDAVRIIVRDALGLGKVK